MEKQSGVCGVGFVGEEYASVTHVWDLRLHFASVGVRKQGVLGIAFADNRVFG
jgi:hypothetical protein